MNKQEEVKYELNIYGDNNEFDCSKHVFCLLNAILRVNKDYLIYSKPVEMKESNKDEKEIIFEQLERIFAYELYHQWSSLLNKDGGLILNGEAQKIIERDRKYPDMVLHGGQGDSKSNEIVVEIKRGKYIDGIKIVEDLEKLSIFLETDEGKEYANYHDAVFILIGGNMDDISNTLNKNKIKTKINNSIIYVTYNYNFADQIYILEIARMSDLNTKKRHSLKVNFIWGMEGLIKLCKIKEQV